MPVLTRGAARRLEGRADENIGVLALREAVTSKAGVVWSRRGDVDVYCGTRRGATQQPQVDHCLEVQLAEAALVRTFGADRRTSTQSMATAQASELIRDALNGLDNLNVTSAKINTGKRGPFTAALNRLQNDRLRGVTIEQLARQGRGQWMVDDGTWARIEVAVVASYDALCDELVGDGVDALPPAARLVAGTVEELESMLSRLGLG